MYVCLCSAVTEEDIRNEVVQGATTLGCLRQRLGVATQCGGCASHAADTLEGALKEHGAQNQALSSLSRSMTT